MRKNLPVTQQEHRLVEGQSLVSKTDLKGRITYANQAFVDASGFALDELIGQPHNLVRHPDMPAAAFADLWRTLEQGKPWSAVVKNRRKNGDHYWVVANVTPVIVEGRIVGYMSVRTIPTRAQVAASEDLYRRMREGHARGLAIVEGQLVRTGIAGWVGRLRRLGLMAQLRIAAVANVLAMIAIGATAWLGTSPLAIAAAVAAGCTVALSTAWVIGHGIAVPVVRALAAARGISAGQVDFRTATRRSDDGGRLLRALQQTAINLTAVVQDIQQSTGAIDQVTGRLATEMDGLSSRTEAQAASVEETAASMEELSSTIKNNADNAQQANALVVGAAQVAERGGEVVRQVVDTMTSISESSRRIEDIIGVIDTLAFQTNLLALNAAVEAAGAGEHGRGFAVVAAEVRHLAQRSAAAAKEIKALIGDSVARVDAGTKLADHAGRTMEEIVTAVRDVTAIMGEIAATSREQALGIEQVAQAVQQIDEITQQNATLVEGAALATAALGEQSRGLSAAVDVFEVPRRARAGATPAAGPGRRPAPADPAAWVDDASERVARSGVRRAPNGGRAAPARADEALTEY